MREHERRRRYSPQAEALLRGIVRKLNLILSNQEAMMATMQDLNAAVARNTDTQASVIVLLEGISKQLKDARAANDPAAIDAAIAQLDANTAAAAAAVVANTPAA